MHLVLRFRDGVEDDIRAFRPVDSFHADVVEASKVPERAHVFRDGRIVDRVAHLCGEGHAAHGAGESNRVNQEEGCEHPLLRCNPRAMWSFSCAPRGETVAHALLRAASALMPTLAFS